ncbi:MAG: flagellin lysine-N-methylase [Clostridia bacterium]|nr:flagellin lysine-N-methylase [Clostridia bacterium]
MKIYAPDYYKNFKCINSQCRHNCCIGWEIDIDENTYEYYKLIGGNLGERLNKNISHGDCPHFILDKNERCPFLNSENLCDIICAMGEDALCQICSDHPRYRNFYSDREEIGVGLCCEAAARLIVEKSDKTVIIEISDDGENDRICDEDKAIFELRDKIFCTLQNRDERIDTRLSKVLRLCGAKDIILSKNQYAELFLGLEYMENDWHNILKNIQKEDFSENLPEESDTIFEQLAVYFVYRHLSKVLCGESLTDVISFCVLCTRMVMLLCEYSLSKKGELSLEDIAKISRMFSSEVEYSEENTQALIDFCKQ